MNDLYFKLVCVDEQNPLGYRVLEDETLDTLDDVHKYVKEHIFNHSPELIKWMLIPMKKSQIKLCS